MPRTLRVYPKAVIRGSQWRFLVKVRDVADDDWVPADYDDPPPGSRFRHTVAAGVTVPRPLRLLKVAFTVRVPNAVTDQDIDDALFVDTAQGGATSGETFWETWQGLAEQKLNAMTGPKTQRRFNARWTAVNTRRTRRALRRILVDQRGWTIVGTIHQHEGNRTTVED